MVIGVVSFVGEILAGIVGANLVVAVVGTVVLAVTVVVVVRGLDELKGFDGGSVASEGLASRLEAITVCYVEVDALSAGAVSISVEVAVDVSLDTGRREEDEAKEA